LNEEISQDNLRIRNYGGPSITNSKYH